MKETNYVMLRDKEVVKANDLIQKSRFSLSVLQQKIILYLISQIEYTDTDFHLYEFDIRTFCQVCGIDYNNGGNYNYLKEQIKEIRDKSLWIKMPDGSESLLAWIEKARIDKNSGRIQIRLDSDLRPYLLQLRTNFSKYELIYCLHMKSTYSVRVYELVKSIHYNEMVPYERIYRIDDLKDLLDANIYTTYQHFRENVLDRAVKELNEYTDKIISYEPIKEGRKITKIKLHIESKDLGERIRVRALIDQDMNYDPNQITIWEIEKNG